MDYEKEVKDGEYTDRLETHVIARKDHKNEFCRITKGDVATQKSGISKTGPRVFLFCRVYFSYSSGKELIETVRKWEAKL